MTEESDPFAAIRAVDNEMVADDRARDDKWGAMVRVVDDLARDECPASEDCEKLGLPYDPSDDALRRATVPSAGQLTREPTRAQVRPLAQLVVARLRQREAE